MLHKRSRNIGRIAPTCYADFSGLTREINLLPVNPSHVMVTYETTAIHEKLQSGFEAILTPARHIYAAAGWSARKSWRGRWEIEFPESCPAEFMRQLREWQDRGIAVGIYLPAASAQPYGEENINHRRQRDRLWADGNGYWYTSIYPWVETSLKLYDRDGTKVYEYVNKYTSTNTYGITIVDAGNGRVFLPATQPAYGELYAVYDHLIYGRLLDVPVEPVPFGVHPVYAPKISLQEIDFPPVERTFRLHMTDDPPAGITVAVIPAATVSDATENGSTTPILGGLVVTPTGDGHTNSQNLANPGGTTKQDLWGIYVSPLLVAQVIPAGAKSRVLGCYDVEDPSEYGLYIAYFAYVWRPGIGLVAVLSRPDYDDTSAIEISDDGDAAGTHLIAGVTTQVELNSSIPVERGDRIVVELWGRYTYHKDDPVVARFDGDKVDATPAAHSEVEPANATMWFELDHTLYFVDE